MSTLAHTHLAYVERVERRLRESVAAHPGLVAEAGERTLRSGGKRLRPLLVYLCAAEGARERPQLVLAGCAVELIHMATLVHDDMLDAAPLRRGRPTVWATDGPVAAVATGDYLFARAFAELVETGEVEAVRILSDACLALARGEALQREQAGATATSVDQYLERVRLKTGRLFAAATSLGGQLGGADAGQVELLASFGEELGVAFQVADDILDCDGDPETTGKPLGTDLLDGTVSLPLILAAQLDSAVREVIDRGAQPEDVLPTLMRVVASGAVDLARARADRHAARAEELLAELDGLVDGEPLRAAIATAVRRER